MAFELLSAEIDSLDVKAIGLQKFVNTPADFPRAVNSGSPLWSSAPLKQGRVIGVMVQKPGGGVDKLNSRLRDGIHAVIPQGGNIGSPGQGF